VAREREVNRALLTLLRLVPEEERAVALLSRLELRHPGVTILTPSHTTEPWRATVDPETAPGDDRAMIFTANLPGELLGKLAALFDGSG
jgi:hypothetical protein